MLWYETVLRYVLWLLFFVGLWLILHPYLMPLVNGAKRKTTVLVKKESKSVNAIYRMIQNFLENTINRSSTFVVYSFVAFLIMISALTFGGLYTNGRPLAESILWTLVAPLIPLGFLYLKLHSTRIKISYEGKEMLSEILNNYRIHHFNMTEAIEQSIYGLGKKYPHSKKMLTRLLIGIREHRNEKELREVVDGMVYSINSNWSILLANLVYIAILRGDDVQDGLVDISRDLAELEQINEKNRQLNIEGGLMLKVVVPAIAIGGLYLLHDMFGFTIPQYVDYQFNNSIGFTSFYYTMIVTLFTILLYLFMRKEKNDF